MKAMLLAAGLGTRLRPLTEITPKPLLEVGGKSLIEHHLQALSDIGVSEVVINLHHLAEKISDRLGDEQHGMAIRYVHEAELLETGGGIKNALPLLGEDPFIVISADVYLDFDLSRLLINLEPDCPGILVMTDNAAHHPEGDFALLGDGRLSHAGEKLTWASVGLFSPALVRDEPDDVFKLRKVFDEQISAGRLRGLYHDGFWCDVGTLERYEALCAAVGQVVG